jgi:hypothetical protein
MIRKEKFTSLFVLYILASLGIFLVVSFNTALGFLQFIFMIAPLYIIFTLYYFRLSSKCLIPKICLLNFSLFTTIFTQFLMILTSPADCHGWFQGQSCSSLLNLYFSQYSRYWSGINSMNSLFILVYFASLWIYLITIYENHEN